VRLINTIILKEKNMFYNLVIWML